jgi:hypothetical protein
MCNGKGAAGSEGDTPFSSFFNCITRTHTYIYTFPSLFVWDYYNFPPAPHAKYNSYIEGRDKITWIRNRF